MDRNRSNRRKEGDKKQFRSAAGKRYGKASEHEPQRKKKPTESSTVKIPSEGVRLNKYLAHAGVCSRREADNLIGQGLVTVNGNVVTEMGHKVKPTDEVTYDGQTLSTEVKRYVLLNKPKGFITTVSDPHARKTVMELVENACEERIVPVGRLDRNTTGLLLFTNDGDLAQKLTHPSSEIRKIYHVHVDKAVQEKHLQAIRDGIELEDGPIAADFVDYVEGTVDRKEIGIELHSGKNRIVRRIFEHFGYEVERLDRVVFAGLTKRDLSRGRFRHLSDKEIQALKHKKH